MRKPIDLAEIGDRYLTVSRLTSLMLRSSCEDLDEHGPCWNTCEDADDWCAECVRRNEAYHLRKKARRQLNAAVSSYKRSESRRLSRRST